MQIPKPHIRVNCETTVAIGFESPIQAGLALRLSRLVLDPKDYDSYCRQIRTARVQEQEKLEPPLEIIYPTEALGRVGLHAKEMAEAIPGAISDLVHSIHSAIEAHVDHGKPGSK